MEGTGLYNKMFANIMNTKQNGSVLRIRKFSINQSMFYRLRMMSGQVQVLYSKLDLLIFSS